ncbi:DDE-type integrase/transposase/recombinase, partial [Myroides sp. 1372]|uniref:DDE-type integrase/transposase/recombinase n=1 Tax=Myroides sp. 1372 TaxID=2746737 RepID=UPI00257795B9
MHKVCEACQLGKQTKHAFSHDKHVSTRPLDLIHSDVWGPAKTTTILGWRFYVTFIDDHTRKVWVYFMKEKSEVFTHFQNFRMLAEKQTGLQVKCLRSDGGGEYTSYEFKEYCRDHVIKRQYTTPHTPQQNGVAERMNRTLVEKARSMLKAKSLPNMLWA